MGLFSRVVVWAKSPYHADMSVGGWFLFVALIIVIITLWTRVMREIVR